MMVFGWSLRVEVPCGGNQWPHTHIPNFGVQQSGNRSPALNFRSLKGLGRGLLLITFTHPQHLNLIFMMMMKAAELKCQIPMNPFLLLKTVSTHPLVPIMTLQHPSHPSLLILPAPTPHNTHLTRQWPT